MVRDYDDGTEASQRQMHWRQFARVTRQAWNFAGKALRGATAPWL